LSRVAGADGDEDVHAAAARVYECGAHVDEFADTDGSVEVDVADGRGDAVAGAPLRGGGVGSRVDPFEQRARIDEAGVTDVDRPDAKLVDRFVAAYVWRNGLV